MQASQTTAIAFAVRESELASTVKTAGSTSGAVILALQAELSDPAAQIEVLGITLLGNTSVNGKRTPLLRATEAGVKLIRITGTGTGTARLKISLAGDLNRDGNVDGADSVAFNTLMAASLADPQAGLGAGTNGAGTNGADINGDGQTTAVDRQILYANYGFRANQAPLQMGTTALTALTALTTHTDLSKETSLASIAQDLEADAIFWRVLATTHGQAQLGADGQTLLFAPEAGYAGAATITLQADDGFAASAPIQLSVNVSDAKLIAIRITNLAALANLQAGQSLRIEAQGDFADEAGVKLTGRGLNGNYLSIQAQDLAAWGVASTATQSAVAVNDLADTVRANTAGAATITLLRVQTQTSGQRAALKPPCFAAWPPSTSRKAKASLATMPMTTKKPSKSRPTCTPSRSRSRPTACASSKYTAPMPTAASA